MLYSIEKNYVIIFCGLLLINSWKYVWNSDGEPEDPLKRLIGRIRRILRKYRDPET